MGINVTCDHTLEELYDNKYFCPGNFTNCQALSGTSTVRSIFLGIEPTYVSLVSCSFSVLGSLLIVFSYWRWKDIRTGSHTVVTWLAIADMFTAGGYILGSANFIKYYDLPSGTFACVHFQQICKIQSFLTTWSSMSSFVWTAYLAIYIYLTLVRGRIILANRLIPLVHVIAWIGPFFIAYPLLIVKKLGLSRVSASNWCFVSVLNSELEGTELTTKVFLLTLWAGKLWELVTYVLVVVLYVLVKCHIRKEVSSRIVCTSRVSWAIATDIYSYYSLQEHKHPIYMDHLLHSQTTLCVPRPFEYKGLMLSLQHRPNKQRRL